ncbi:Uncharacterised protein [Klebsiella quasipneumoniae]|nr:Uncharacterised protein [Klebsiella quasipneumoniae]
MHSKKRRLSVLCACLMTMLCGCSGKPGNAPQLQQQMVFPAEMTVKCPPPEEADDNSMDASAVALKKLYDLYGICAGRHADLIQYLQNLQGK